MPIVFPHRPGLVAYITVGDPDLATTRDIALAAIDNGADVIELGVPFSDPLADGPVIQRAAERAVARGITLHNVLALSLELRQARPACGLVLFSYLNPVVRMGKPRANYRETIRGASDGEGEYIRQIGVRGNYAVVKLHVEPNDPGKGYEFLNVSNNDRVPTRFVDSINAGVRKAMAAGVVAGCEMVDIKVTLRDGKYHHSDSNEMAFQIAASKAFSDAARKARPILLEPVMSMTIFCAAAADAGLDGVLLTDMVIEEAGEYLTQMRAHHLAPVFLAAPTSPDARLKAIAEHSRGFVYAVSRVGITGTQETVASDAPELVARLRRFTTLPIAVGFGISNAEHVRAVGAFADAAVVGSAIVRLIEQSEPAEAAAAVGAFIRGLHA